MPSAAESHGPFTPAYVERCRVARLPRWPGPIGPPARRLERGDFYAWRLGPPTVSGSVRVSQIVEPRTVYTVDDRLWWIPRLDQLLDWLEMVARTHATVPGDSVREGIARQLAGRLSHAAGSWEEAALDLLLGEGAGLAAAVKAPFESRRRGGI